VEYLALSCLGWLVVRYRRSSNASRGSSLYWYVLQGQSLSAITKSCIVGIVALATRRYFDWASALHRYVALFAWTMACWISFNPLIDRHVEAGASEKNERIISFIARLLFGVFLCSCVLLFEKFR